MFHWAGIHRATELFWRKRIERMLWRIVCPLPDQLAVRVIRDVRSPRQLHRTVRIRRGRTLLRVAKSPGIGLRRILEARYMPSHPISPINCLDSQCAQLARIARAFRCRLRLTLFRRLLRSTGLKLWPARGGVEARGCQGRPRRAYQRQCRGIERRGRSLVVRCALRFRRPFGPSTCNASRVFSGRASLATSAAAHEGERTVARRMLTAREHLHTVVLRQRLQPLRLAQEPTAAPHRKRPLLHLHAAHSVALRSSGASHRDSS